MCNSLKIDKVFQNLIPPLSVDEYKQLEENLIREGCRDQLCIWNDIIVDGHNRHEICLRHNIPFQIKQVHLKNRHEAIAWICANQIGRRNITEETRRYLIGKRYEAEKIIGIHNRTGNNQYTKNNVVRTKMLFEPDNPIRESFTARRLGEEYRLSHATITKYGAYSRAVDTLAEKNEELVPKILSGQTKISQDNLIELAKLPIKDLKRVSKQLLENDRDFVGFAAARKRLDGPPRPQSPIFNAPPETSIKNIPAFDPDAELSSLTLTIPSWISSLERINCTTNFDLASIKAKDKLSTMLDKLKNTSNQLLELTREQVNG